MTLRGLTTISFWADDVDAARRWYAELLGIDAYLVRPGPDGRPAYVEFRLGDYQHELGIVSRAYAPPGVTADLGGAVVYWHVDDVDAALAKVLAMGGREHEKPVDRGEGFITATAVDPFGNILGLMYNPHYLEILGRR
jgi:predicted enzyme related to lactoylglutathione lyase